jgi:hypothetical protein
MDGMNELSKPVRVEGGDYFYWYFGWVLVYWEMKFSPAYQERIQNGKPTSWQRAKRG